MSVDLQTYFDLQVELYKHHGILLSQAELALFDGHADVLTVTPDLKLLTDKSRESLDRELNLQIATLTEAEAARDQAELLRTQAEDAAVKLEDANQKLAGANSQLQERNDLTEAKLKHEQDMRAQQSKADFQKNLAMYLVALIAVALVLPYVFSVFKPIGQELSSSTYNLTLLLINGLMIAVGSIFNRRENDKEE